MKMRMVAAGMTLAGLCLAAAGIAGCGGKEKAKDAAADSTSRDSSVVKVTVVDVKEVPFEDWGSYPADLRGIEDANLTAPYQGGRVNSIKPVGTRVKAGEALCDIDGEKYEAALQAAEAQVEVTKGDLERAKVNVEKGSLGRSALDGANLAYQNARMLLASARRAYEDSRCQAPFDGVMVSRAIEKFQTLSPGVLTLRLSRLDRFEAVISIPETEAFLYAEGMKTEFKLLQDSTRSYDGRITSVDGAVDARSRSAIARIEIVNRDGRLKPGMMGRARILRRAYAKAVVVPSASLVHLQSGISAMVVVNGMARQRELKIGAESGDSAMVIQGLRPGDKLVISGAFQLSEGTRVTY
ncbi:MAG: efflux RND transporter periplasmic adaptor subunit [Fibrobacterota bacterium]